MATPTNGASAVRVLCAGAMHPIIDALARLFERASGLRMAAEFASSGGVKERVMAGAHVDSRRACHFFELRPGSAIEWRRTPINRIGACAIA